MNKLEFQIETAGFHYIIECKKNGYYFFFDPEKEELYDISVDNIEISLDYIDISINSTEEELFQSELVNDSPFSVHVYYKILKLFKMRIPNKKFTIEY